MRSQYTTLHLDTLLDECGADIMSVLISGEVQAEITKKGLIRIKTSDLERFYHLINKKE